MTYIERDSLIDELKRYEMRRVSANGKTMCAAYV